MKSAPTIAFDYRPSRRIAAAAALVTAAAGCAPWASGAPWPLRALLSALALAVGAGALRRFLRPRFGRVAYRASGWVLVDASGAESPARLESQACIGGLLALGFRPAARARFHVLLAPDNLEADARRRLVLMLARAEVAQAP